MTTITSATAATEAHVTVATIRTWCRRNVIAAVKQAGRWVINAASLARRIAIGKERRMSSPIEHRIDDTTTLRVVRTVIPVSGRVQYHAQRYDNGYYAGSAGAGETADEALHRGIALVESLLADSRRHAALEDAGILADLTSGTAKGLHGRMAAATGVDSPARNGECHYCGLNARTCDCY